MYMFRNNANFCGEELIVCRTTPKLEDHSLSAVRDCLFNTFAATLHIGGRFFTRSMKDAQRRGERDRWRAFVSAVMNLWVP